MTEREAWQRVIWAWQSGDREQARRLEQEARAVTLARVRSDAARGNVARIGQAP